MKEVNEQSKGNCHWYYAIIALLCPLAAAVIVNVSFHKLKVYYSAKPIDEGSDDVLAAGFARGFEAAFIMFTELLLGFLVGLAFAALSYNWKRSALGAAALFVNVAELLLLLLIFISIF